MAMVIRQSTFTIANYVRMWDQGELAINRDYQRSDEIWPLSSRQFFIETLLLGFPIPKLYLFQSTDIKTKLTKLEVVDGQQRTQAIVDFIKDKFRLGKRCAVDEAANKRFGELDEPLQRALLEYGIPCDVFVAATAADVREIFRRMNSYTVSLNAEEKRHATYQGSFKWFIYEVSKAYGETLKDIGVLTEKSLTRMQDAKLFADFSYAVLRGIQTTKARELDSIYDDFDDGFSEEGNLSDRINAAMGFVVQQKDLHNTALTKPHLFLCLLLAITHLLKPASKLKPVVPRTKGKRLDASVAVPRLTSMAAAIEAGQTRGKYGSLVASTIGGGTNVKEKRELWFKWFSAALDGETH